MSQRIVPAIPVTSIPYRGARDLADMRRLFESVLAALSSIRDALDHAKERIDQTEDWYFSQGGSLPNGNLRILMETNPLDLPEDWSALTHQQMLSRLSKLQDKVSCILYDGVEDRRYLP